MSPLLAAVSGDALADEHRSAALILVWIGVLGCVVTLLWPGGRGWRMALRIHALAVLGFREGLRLKVLWTVALLSLLPGTLAYLSDADGTHAGRAKLILDTSVVAGEILGAALIVMLSALSVSREIESRVMHTLGTKPVPRWGILAGKALGFWAVDLLFLALLLGYTGILVRAVPLRAETRSNTTLAGSGSWNELERNVLTTRNYTDEPHTGPAKSRRLKPGQKHTSRFELDPDIHRDADLAIRFQLSTNTFAPSIPNIKITAAEPGKAPILEQVVNAPQGRPFELFVDGRQIGGTVLDVTVVSQGRDPLMMLLPGEGKDMKFRAGSVRLGATADSFWENLLRAGGVLALQGWILALITTGWSGVLSFPVTVALGLIMALGGASSRYAIELMQFGAERAESLGMEGARQSNTVAEYIFFVVKLLPDFHAAGSPTAFLDGTAASTWALAHAILWMGVVRTFGWALPGVLLFQWREVGK